MTALEAPLLNLRERHSVLSVTHNSTVRLYHDGQARRACQQQQALSAPSHSFQIILSSPAVSPPTSSPAWDGPLHFFIPLVISCCSVSTFCRSGGVSSHGRHNYQISYLSSVPLLSALQLAVLPGLLGGVGGRRSSCHSPKKSRLRFRPWGSHMC